MQLNVWVLDKYEKVDRHPLIYSINGFLILLTQRNEGLFTGNCNSSAIGNMYDDKRLR